MTFAKAVKSELRAAFGPKWAASAAMWAVVALGFVIVAFIGMDVMQAAETLGDTIANSGN